MDDLRIGFALTGSFCTIDKALAALEETVKRWPGTRAATARSPSAASPSPIGSTCRACTGADRSPDCSPLRRPATAG